MHPHFSGDMTKNGMTVFKLHLKRCIGKVFNYFTLHFNNIFF